MTPNEIKVNTSAPLRIIFAGTPEFAAQALAALLRTSQQIVAVYTQPDRPAGRGRQLKPSAVKAMALKHHLPIEQPASLKTPEAQSTLAWRGTDSTCDSWMKCDNTKTDLIAREFGVIIQTGEITYPVLNTGQFIETMREYRFLARRGHLTFFICTQSVTIFA